MTNLNKIRLQKLAGLLKEQDGSFAEKNTKSPYKELGLTANGYYWFRDFEWGEGHWEIVEVTDATTEQPKLWSHTWIDEAYLFQGTKEEYLTSHESGYERMGKFVGPLKPPK